MLHQWEETITESFVEKATKEVLQKRTEKLLLATPESVTTIEKSDVTQEHTVTMSENLAADNNEFQLYDEECRTASEIQRDKQNVHRDVEFTEHLAVDGIGLYEKVEEVEEEILLQEKQTVEIVEKTIDECEEVSATLPWLVILETDRLGNQREQETHVVGLPDVDDLLTMQISRESFSEDESITISIVAEQLTHGDSLLRLDEEMEFVIPMVAGTETAKDEDRTNVDRGERVDESIDSRVEADESAFVTQAEEEMSTQPEQQLGEDVDISAQPEVQFNVAISKAKPDIKVSVTVGLPDEGASQEIESCVPQLQVKDHKVKQQLEEPAATEEHMISVEDTAVENIVVEFRQYSQAVQLPVEVESMTPLVHVVDESESLVVEAEKEASFYAPRTAEATDEMLIRSRTEELKSSQSKIEEDATAREAEVAAKAVEEVSAIQAEESAEKRGETVEEPLIVCQEAKAENAEALQREVVATDYLAKAKTEATKVNVLTATEAHDDGTTGQDRYEKEPSTEFEALQLTTQASEMATSEMTQAVETVAISTAKMQVEMSELHLDVLDIDDIDMLVESDTELVHDETAETEVRTVLIDIQKSVLMTPQVLEGEVNILETESDGQYDKVIETLRPAVREKEFVMKGSEQSASGPEDMEICMKKDTELTLTSGSEEATLEQLLKEASDIETHSEVETMKPVIEEAVTAAVVFSPEAEHEIELLVFQHAFDFYELATVAADEMAATLSHTEDEIVAELLEVDMAHREKKTSESILSSVAGEATSEHFEVESESESTLLAAVNEVTTSALYATDKQKEVTKDVQFLCLEIRDIETDVTAITDAAHAAMMQAEGEGLCETKSAGDSIITMQFSRECASGEIDVSRIVFPTLPIDDSMPGVASVDEAAVCVDTTHEMQFHKTLETPSHLKTDSTKKEKTSVMMDAKCTVHEDVQSEPIVPYSSSVIVHSDDMYAPTNAIVESLVDKCVVDSAHITEMHFSEQDELTVSFNEEVLCDDLTVVFPENVESSLLGNQPSSDITETEIVDLPEQSSLYSSILLTTAEKDELQKDDNMEQLLFELQNAAVESTAIQITLSDKSDTLIARPEKPEVSETISPEDKATEIVQNVDDFFQESLVEGDVVIHSPLLAACSDDVYPLKTDLQDLDILPQSHLAGTEVSYVCEKSVDVLLDRIAVDENRELDRPDGSSYLTGDNDSENFLSMLEHGQTFDAVQATGSDLQRLEPVYVDQIALSSQQTQQFEAASKENEREMEKQAISSKTSHLTEVDSEESEAARVCETVNIKSASYEVTPDDSQRREPESVKGEENCVVPQNEDEIKSLVDLPFDLLFAGLLGDDSTKSVTFSGEAVKEDDGYEGIEAPDVDQEKHVQHQAVTDDKPAESSAASKSSVVTRRVQRVSSDGRVIERVKSEEVPLSFGPASLTPYFLSGDLPSPPDFSPQSDDRQLSASSIKVYTDTVKGEPWTERRVDEVTETQPDGTTVTRKVVRVRKRRTIIKHIVIEGPEFEEMILDEPQNVAITGISGTSNVEGDIQSRVDEQLELLASERKPTSLQSDMDSAPVQLSADGDTAGRKEDFSHIGNTETGDSQPVDKLSSYVKEETNERTLIRDDDTDKDTTSNLPPQQASVAMPVSHELSDARVSSQPSLLVEPGQYGESEYILLDFDRDRSCSVGDGPGLDNVESASSCGDFATGILRYGRK